MAKVDAKTLEARIAELEAQLKKSQAEVAAGQELALEKVCKAVGVSTESIKNPKVNPKDLSHEPKIRMFVATPVRVNMQVFDGHITVPLSVARVVWQAIGDRRTRLINELTHHKFQLKELLGGGYASVVTEVRHIDNIGA